MADTAALGGAMIANRYRLVRPLGAGGMGQVWYAHDTTLDRTVAVKRVLTPSDQSDEQRAERVQRAFREARNAARVSNHPNIVTVHDVVEEGGMPWIVMEYVASRSLAEHIAERGALPPVDVARIGTALMEALVAVHAANIVHRDIKPANILIADGGQVLLTDFGIAVAETDVTMTSTGAVIATPEYMAPERADGHPASAASDVFSLGATLYEAAEGISPFRRDTPLAMLKALVFEEPRQFQLAGPLGPLLYGLLAKDPQLRPSAAQARTMFEGYKAAVSAAVPPTMAAVPPIVVAGGGSAEAAEAEAEAVAPPVPPGPRRYGAADAGSGAAAGSDPAAGRAPGPAPTLAPGPAPDAGPATATAAHGALGATAAVAAVAGAAAAPDAPIRSGRFARSLALWLLVQTALFVPFYSLVHLRLVAEDYDEPDSAKAEHVVLIGGVILIAVAIVTVLALARSSHRLRPALLAAGVALGLDALWALAAPHFADPWSSDSGTSAPLEAGWSAMVVVDAALLFGLAAAAALARSRAPEWFVLGGAFVLDVAAVVTSTTMHLSLTDDHYSDPPTAFHTIAAAIVLGLAGATFAVWLAARRAGAAARVGALLGVLLASLVFDVAWVVMMPTSTHYENWSSERLWRVPLVAGSLLLAALAVGAGRMRAARGSVPNP